MMGSVTRHLFRSTHSIHKRFLLKRLAAPKEGIFYYVNARYYREPSIGEGYIEEAEGLSEPHSRPWFNRNRRGMKLPHSPRIQGHTQYTR